jgi:hypothetical protein
MDTEIGCFIQPEVVMQRRRFSREYKIEVARRLAPAARRPCHQVAPVVRALTEQRQIHLQRRGKQRIGRPFVHPARLVDELAPVAI